MDPLAHSFTGAALAAAGLRRATPLATAALLIGANAPDVDILASFGPDYAARAFRRGWTHGVLAMACLPVIVAGALLAWNRLLSRYRPDAPPVRAGPLLVVTALAVATHPTLDWLNSYGLRWLMPFDGRWFYGDALFIVDPWMWLVLGGVAFLAYSRRPAALAAWVLFWLLASALVLTNTLPAGARALWVAGLAVLLAARCLRPLGSPPRRLEPVARAALALSAAYMGALALANLPARAAVRQALEHAGVGPIESVMVGPVPADPFIGEVVAETPAAYYLGRWDWRSTPRFRPAPEPLPKHDSSPIAAAAARVPEARRFLTWSRFPYFVIESGPSGHVVRILDARYRDGRLPGVTVRLDASLHPLPLP